MRWIVVGLAAFAVLFVGVASLVALDRGWDAMIASIWPEGIAAFGILIGFTVLLAAVVFPLTIWADKGRKQ